MLPAAPVPAMVQADPEVVLISLFPILEREAWQELLERSQVLLRGSGVPEATRAKLHWMVLRAVCGAAYERRLSLARAAAALDPLVGQRVSFPLRPLAGDRGWVLAADRRSAEGTETSGRSVQMEVRLDLATVAQALEGEVIATGTFMAWKAPEGLVRNPRLRLSFADTRLERP